MTLRALSVDFLLALTVGCCWVGCVGMLRMRDALQGLHYLAPAATVAVVCLAGAVWLQMGFGGSTLKVSFIALIVAATGSVATHAVARAFWLRHSAQSGTARRAIGSEDQ